MSQLNVENMNCCIISHCEASCKTVSMLQHRTHDIIIQLNCRTIHGQRASSEKGTSTGMMPETITPVFENSDLSTKTLFSFGWPGVAAAVGVQLVSNMCSTFCSILQFCFMRQFICQFGSYVKLVSYGDALVTFQIIHQDTCAQHQPRSKCNTDDTNQPSTSKRHVHSL